MLYTHDYAQFARLESVIRKLHSVDNCWTMKAAGNKTFIITLTPASKTALISEWLVKAIVKKKIMYVVDEILRNSDKAWLQFFFVHRTMGLLNSEMDIDTLPYGVVTSLLVLAWAC